MMRTSKSMVVCSSLICCLLVGSAFGVSNGEKAKVKGVIYHSNRRHSDNELRWRKRHRRSE